MDVLVGVSTNDAVMCRKKVSAFKNADKAARSYFRLHFP